MSFSKAVSEAQEMPPVPDELEKLLPDVFYGNEQSSLGTRVETDTPGKIKGSVQYDLEYFCERLMMGEKELGVDFDNKQTQVESVDDSARLKQIMDKQLNGEAVIINKSETFLKNGTVVIWVEWAQPKDAASKKDRSFLTEEELRSPELPSEEDSPGAK